MSDLPQYWYKDKDLLKAEFEEHGTLHAVAVAHNMNRSTLSVWWKKLGLPKLTQGPKPSQVKYERQEHFREYDIVKALKKLGDEATIESLADECDCAPKTVRKALEHLEGQGFRLETESSGDAPGDTTVRIHRVPPPESRSHEILFGGEEVRFAIVGDVHLGSKECMLDELHIAYDRIQAEGIDTVYNPGDLVCGIGIYRGQINDILYHTYRDQVDFARENYPRRDGVTTRIIGGNHDLEGEAARIGANPVLAVANQRDDIIYDGDYSAWYTFPQGTSIYMVHPKGGGSYARSYKLQKFAESFEGGRKPSILIAGHYHDALYLPNERGIQMLKAGTFEGGGSLGLRLPLRSPMVGFWIVDMTLADDGSVVRFRPEWFPFYQGRKVSVTVK